MNQLTVNDLRNLARQRGLQGYSRLRKDELIKLLGITRSPRSPRPNNQFRNKLENLSKCQVREQLRARGQTVSGTKTEMINRLINNRANKLVTPYKITVPPGKTPRVYRRDLESMTKCQIREELRNRGAKISGTKEEIIRRLSYILAGKREP